MKRKFLLEILIHILFWTLFPILLLYQDQNIMIGVFQTEDPNFLIALLYGTIFNMILTYTIIFIILSYYFNKKKYAVGIIITLLFYFLFGLVEGLVDYFVIKYIYFIDPANIADRIDDQIYISALVVNLPFLLISFVYRLAHDWYKNEKVKQQLIEEQLRNELQFLKSQINPHFLFNTLNNLFGMARNLNAIPVADGIVKLSNLMRYMIYDSESELVSLEKEISYIKDYIELQKLRIKSQNLEINMNINNESKKIKIAPLILLPFIENAFKHGNSIKEDTRISITLLVEKNTINFNVSNTINKLRSLKENDSSGFGLKNVQKRLNLIYANQYILNISKNETKYTVTLKIDV